MPQLPSILKWLDLALVAAGGLILLVFLLGWAIRGCRDPLRGAPIRANRLSLVHVWICLVVYILGWSIGGSIGSQTAPAGARQEWVDLRSGIIGATVAQVLVIIAVLMVSRTAFLGGLRGLGLGRRSISFDILAAVAGWLVALCVCGLIVLAVELAIARLWPEFTPPTHTVFQMLDDAGTGPLLRALAMLSAGLLAPVGEELLFRGVLQTSLRRALPPRHGSRRHRWLAIFVVAVLFGAMHSATPQHVPALVALGVILGFLYERTGSLTVPVLLHILFNGKSLLWYQLQTVLG